MKWRLLRLRRRLFRRGRVCDSFCADPHSPSCRVCSCFDQDTHDEMAAIRRLSRGS
jgi:hypothetical protein